MLWLASALVLFFLVNVLVAYISVFPPRTPIFLSPGSLGLEQEDVLIPPSDGEHSRINNRSLPGWWINSENPVGIAIYCHGYIMNRCELTPIAIELSKRGWHGLVFDFEGHGKAPRGAVGLGMNEVDQVRAAYEFAKHRFPDLPIVMVGSSMGSAAIVFACEKNLVQPNAIVLDSVYSTLLSASLGWWDFIGGKALKFFLWPVPLLAMPMARINGLRADVTKSLKRVQTPVLLLHGTIDRLAKPKHAHQNAAALGENARVIWFDQCDHSEGRWVQPEKYRDEILKFIGPIGRGSSTTMDQTEPVRTH